MDTFPIVRRKDEAANGEYRTRRVILEMYDQMAALGVHDDPDRIANYQTPLDPPPGDIRAARKPDPAYQSRVNPTPSKPSIQDAVAKPSVVAGGVFARGHEPWSKEEEARLTQMHEAGQSLEAISEILQRDPRALASRLQKIQERKRKWGRWGKDEKTL